MKVSVTIKSDVFNSHTVQMTEQEVNNFITYLGRELTTEEIADPKMVDRVQVTVRNVTENG